MNQDRTKHRLTRHLQSLADDATVPESSPDAARRRARQRTVARRRGVTAGLAAASVAGVVAGVSILSTPATTTLQTSDDGSTRDTAPGSEAAPPNAATVPASVADTSAVVQREATSDDPAFVWKVVEPDKDSSVNGTFSGDGVTSYPTLIVSTAPGRSNDYDNIETVVWQTDDGIEFTQSSLTSPFSAGVWQPEFVADDIYSVGTAPGIAVNDPNPLQVAVNGFDGTDDDWRSIDLPIDAHEFADLPMAFSSLAVSRVPLDDRLLVVATPQIYPDYEEVARSQGLDADTFLHWNEADGGIEYADADCMEGDGQIDGPYTSTTMVVDASSNSIPVDGPVATVGENPPASTTPPGDVVGTAPADYYETGGGCPLSFISWADAGVPAETIAALESAASRFFTIDADLNVSEIESPVPGAKFASFLFGQGARFVDVVSDGAYSLYTDEPGPPIPFFEFDGTGFVTGEMPGVNWQHQPASFGEGLAGMSWSSSGTTFTIVDATNTIAEVDLRPLLGENTNISDGSLTAPAAAGGRLVFVVSESDDPIAEAGGIELTVDGVTIRRDSAMSDIMYLDAASGEVIPDDRIVFDMRGGVTVVAADGAVMAEFTEEQLYNDLEGQIDWSDVGPGRYSVLTTADGQAFSVESVADLLGVDDSNVSHVSRVVSDGTTVTITVTLNERYEDDTRKQLVLVGTPIG